MSTDRTFFDLPADLPSGAWKAKRRLASLLRELNELCVTTDAPQGELEFAAGIVYELVRNLRRHPRRTFGDAFRSGLSADDSVRFADRSTLVGRSNPIAPPMLLAPAGDAAAATVRFGPVFEGAPGRVHGGILAAAFDQLFGYAQLLRKVASLTGRLSVRYLQPTPIDTALRFSARTIRSNGRKSWLAAEVRAGDTVTATASALFIELDPQKPLGT